MNADKVRELIGKLRKHELVELDGAPYVMNEERHIAYNKCADELEALANEPPTTGGAQLQGEPLLRKLATSWIDTGLHGTGLFKHLKAEEKTAIQGIYEYCGKTLLEYLDYKSAAAPQEQGTWDARAWLDREFPVDDRPPSGDESLRGNPAYQITHIMERNEVIEVAKLAYTAGKAANATALKSQE